MRQRRCGLGTVVVAEVEVEGAGGVQGEGGRGAFAGITSYVLCATRRGVSVNHMRLELQAQRSD